MKTITKTYKVFSDETKIGIPRDESIENFFP